MHAISISKLNLLYLTNTFENFIMPILDLVLLLELQNGCHLLLQVLLILPFYTTIIFLILSHTFQNFDFLQRGSIQYEQLMFRIALGIQNVLFIVSNNQVVYTEFYTSLCLVWFFSRCQPLNVFNFLFQNIHNNDVMIIVVGRYCISFPT